MGKRQIAAMQTKLKVISAAEKLIKEKGLERKVSSRYLKKVTTYVSTSTATSKRGSPQLRKTLFNIMTILLPNAPADDPVFRFIDKKRAEGKPYYVYMTAGANKFLRIYYGRVKEYLAKLDDLPPVDYDSTGLPPQE